jgi:drug/metabolite transporter (DMT)-like permease
MILASQMPAVHIYTGPIETWATILTVAATAVAGDVLTAGAMRRIGDLDLVRAKAGLGGAVRAVTSSPMFLLGVLCMAVSFFSLLFTLSNVEVSLAAPASASLTFLGNAFAAKIFLKENVNRRRWLAALFVCAGVFLLAK